MKHFRARRVMKRDVPGTARLMGRERAVLECALPSGFAWFHSEMRLSVEGRSHARTDSDKYPDVMAGVYELCIVHCARHFRWLDVDMK